jgi:predicted tellurium resistance membrane protein TerC
MLQEAIIPLITLICLEVILGIDNVIFISILSEKLPAEQRDKLRYIGMGLAVIMRLILLSFISWILQLSTTLFTVFNLDISGKDLILLVGGIFLLYKSTKEIYHNTESDDEMEHLGKTRTGSFGKLLGEVLLLDLVFSIDSIITAVGMASQLWIMSTAVIISVMIMLFASKSISNFIHKHPSFKILALCFLMMIGMALVGEGLHFEIPKGYIYFSMAFAFLVDLIQIKTVKNK